MRVCDVLTIVNITLTCLGIVTHGNWHAIYGKLGHYQDYLHSIYSFASMKWCCFRPLLCTLFRLNWAQADAGDNEAKLITKLAPEWVRTSDPVIRSPARYRWSTAPAPSFTSHPPNGSTCTVYIRVHTYIHTCTCIWMHIMWLVACEVSGWSVNEILTHYVLLNLLQ